MQSAGERQFAVFLRDPYPVGAGRVVLGLGRALFGVLRLGEILLLPRRLMIQCVHPASESTRGSFYVPLRTEGSGPCPFRGDSKIRRSAADGGDLVLEMQLALLQPGD